MAARSGSPLRIVGDAGVDAADDSPPVFIGPDYARLRKTDWGGLHARADRRDPIDLPAPGGRWRGTDARRFER